MPRMTRKEHDELALSRKERDLARIALQCVMTEKPDESVEAAVDGWRYRYDLYRALGPHGGIVVVTAETDGQKPDVSARYLEDLRPDTQTLAVPLELRSAIERLFVARQRLEARETAD